MKALFLYIVVIAGVSAGLAQLAISQIHDNVNTRQATIEYWSE